MNVFGPDIIIPGGVITLARGERPLGPVLAVVDELTLGAMARATRVTAAALEDDAGLVGAAPLTSAATARTDGR